jgi:hypothetical protein
MPSWKAWYLKVKIKQQCASKHSNLDAADMMAQVLGKEGRIWDRRNRSSRPALIIHWGCASKNIQIWPQHATPMTVLNLEIKDLAGIILRYLVFNSSTEHFKMLWDTLREDFMKHGHLEWLEFHPFIHTHIHHLLTGWAVPDTWTKPDQTSVCMEPTH